MAAQATYSQRELYGGAIVVELPNNYIDSSTLRQIPDHQEVFLSPTTLTSIIFEINTYQTPHDVQTAQIKLPTHIINESPDRQAAIFHFLDPILPPDHALDSTITFFDSTTQQPHRQSISAFPYYITTGTIVSPTVDRNAPSALPADWAQDPPTKKEETGVIQFFLRMERYQVDFCVRINIPLKEFGEDEGKVAAEMTFAHEILGKIEASLDVRDFGLFGGDDEEE